VYIVDDDRSMRESLRWLVETLGVPVQTFPSAKSFLEGYDPHHPACLVVDVVMPEMSGLELQEELGRRGIEIPVIVLSGHADVAAAVRAFKNRALEFLQKPFDDEVLLAQIRRALAGDAQRRQDRSALDVVRQHLTRLTPREQEVLELVVDGLSSKKIAARLAVSFKTVDVHRANIMKKMETGSVAELVRIVVSARPWFYPDDRRQPGD